MIVGINDNVFDTITFTLSNSDIKCWNHCRWYDYIENGEFLPNTILVTLTNYGYTDLTLNLIKSIEATTNRVQNKQILIHIGCVDTRSYIFWNQFNTNRTNLKTYTNIKLKIIKIDDYLYDIINLLHKTNQTLKYWDTYLFLKNYQRQHIQRYQYTSVSTEAGYGTSNFQVVAGLYKLFLIQLMLKQTNYKKNILFLDSDVVFVNNINYSTQEWLTYFIFYNDLNVSISTVINSNQLSFPIAKYDIIIQADTQDEEWSVYSNQWISLCTGFFFIKPSQTVIEMFSPVKYWNILWDNEIKDAERAADQTYIKAFVYKYILKQTFERYNPSSSKPMVSFEKENSTGDDNFTGNALFLLEWSVFPRDQIPNGWWLYNQIDNCSSLHTRSYIAHFNWVVGVKSKIRRAKKLCSWYL